MSTVLFLVFVLTGATMMLWGLASVILPGFSPRRKGTIVLMVGLVIIVNVILYAREHVWNTARTQPTAAQVAQEGRSVFQQPEAVCNLLSEEGLTPAKQPNTGKVWGKRTPMYYSCQAQRSLAKGPEASQLVYWAQSDGGRIIDLVGLQIDIHDRAQEEQGLERFKQVSRRLFERLPVRIPAGLLAAIDQQRFQQFDQPYGTVELLQDRYDRGYGLRMEIRPNRMRP